jgi:hypothetical protein
MAPKTKVRQGTNDAYEEWVGEGIWKETFMDHRILTDMEIRRNRTESGG